jgi:signal transduction histidine kinase
MHARQITQANIVRVLVAGFALVIALLAAAAFVGVRSIQSIQSSAANLVQEQAVANRLLDEVQHQQAAIGDIFSVLARDPDSVDLDILKQLDQTDQNIERITAQGEHTPERRLWRQLKRASLEFSTEARRILSAENPETFATRDLFRLHGEVVSVIGKLIGQSYRKVVTAQQQIDQRSAKLTHQSIIFLAACFPLALLFTFATVRMTAELFRKMEWQAGELSRVSWHMLDNQESTARRFSHELHDELGQSLTAVKANLAALERGAPDPRRLDDCMRLVDEAIGNVRQLSQLLRPTILDDFGLEAGLHWLAEGFTQRTGIEVNVQGELGGRLPDETETHLFRIAQEALTNVARHSGARHVWMSLAQNPGEVTLSIRDDGRGLPAVAATGDSEPANGMGMIGMRARARSTGGDVTVRSRPGEGVQIEVRVPETAIRHESKDPHPVS